MLNRTGIVIVSRDRPDLVGQLIENIHDVIRSPVDIVVVEAGTSPDKVWSSPLVSTIHYEDTPFSGKALAQMVGVSRVMGAGTAAHVMVMMNDVRFAQGLDPVATMIDALDGDPKLGMVAPCNAGGVFPASCHMPGGAILRDVTVCDNLCFMMRTETVARVGFLRHFPYAYGAITEYAHRLHVAGLRVAYHNAISIHHLGGCTYGLPGLPTREEYIRLACRSALEGLVRRHGVTWANDFWEAAKRVSSPVINTYAAHDDMFRQAFDPDELPVMLDQWSRNPIPDP